MAVAEGTLLAIYRINNQFSPSTVDLSSIWSLNYQNILISPSTTVKC
jgi:hypothetical protein